MPEWRHERISNKKGRHVYWETCQTPREKKKKGRRERERERDNITELYFPLPRTHAWERGKPFSLPLVSSLCRGGEYSVHGGNNNSRVFSDCTTRRTSAKRLGKKFIGYTSSLYLAQLNRQKCRNRIFYEKFSCNVSVCR